jgi:hypothetical protein
MPGPFSPQDFANPDLTEIAAKANALKDRLEAARRDLAKKRHDGAAEPKGPEALSRAEGFWPFLLIRSFPGDSGARPAQAPNMYQSPDLIMTISDPQYQPAVVGRDGMPALMGRQCRNVFVNRRHDVWVHVWNLGRAPAHGARIRAWVVDKDSGAKEFVGGRQLDLGDRTSQNSHTVVRIGSWDAKKGGSSRRELVATVESMSDVATSAAEDRHTARWAFMMMMPY